MTISVIQQTSFDGPNIWSVSPVSCFEISSHSAGEISERLPPKVLDRLWAILADARTLGRSRGARLSLPLEDGSIPALVGQLAVYFQQLFDIDVVYSSCSPSHGRERWQVVVQQTNPRIAASAIRLAVDLLNNVLIDAPRTFDLEERIDNRFISVVDACGESLIHQAVKKAARSRGIPISASPHAITLDLGNGGYRQRTQGASTHRTSSVAVSISHDKHLTKRYLMDAGIPVPDGTIARSEDQAVLEASSLTFPVVIKPNDSGAGTGVFVDLRGEDEVRACSSIALAHSPTKSLVVEEFIAGREYRFLVINDKVEAVVERRPAQIAGDGIHTIEQLVELTNAARLEAIQHRYSRQPIVVNDDSLRLLQREGLSLQSVPASGQRVQLHYDDSRLLGGDFVDSLDLAHPDNLRLARQAAAVVGLDIAGIDIILMDISRSIWETSGAVLEINDRPGLQIFLYPTEGQPRDPGPAIVDMLFPPGSRSASRSSRSRNRRSPPSLLTR
jgi:cyanophycin synthetase